MTIRLALFRYGILTSRCLVWRSTTTPSVVLCHLLARRRKSYFEALPSDRMFMRYRLWYHHIWASCTNSISDDLDQHCSCHLWLRWCEEGIPSFPSNKAFDVFNSLHNFLGHRLLTLRWLSQGITWWVDTPHLHIMLPYVHNLYWSETSQDAIARRHQRSTAWRSRYS